MDREQGREELQQTLSQIALSFSDGDATAAFALLHQAAWDAERLGAKSKRDRRRKGSGHGPLHPPGPLPAPPRVAGKATMGSRASSGSDSSDSFTLLQEEKKGEEEAAAEAASHATTVAAAWLGDDCGGMSDYLSCAADPGREAS